MDELKAGGTMSYDDPAGEFAAAFGTDWQFSESRTILPCEQLSAHWVAWLAELSHEEPIAPSG